MLRQRIRPSPKMDLGLIFFFDQKSIFFNFDFDKKWFSGGLDPLAVEKKIFADFFFLFSLGRLHEAGPKRSVLGPKFRRRSKFAGIICGGADPLPQQGGPPRAQDFGGADPLPQHGGVPVRAREGLRRGGQGAELRRGAAVIYFKISRQGRT